MDKTNTTLVNNLYKAFAQLTDEESINNFLQDLCTPKEIQDMAQRLKVAQMLSENISYVTIQEQTGASATTIARVSRALQYGPKGYHSVLNVLSEEE